MKKLYTIVIFLLIATTLIAQSPASFKYQAVLRDIRGNVKANTSTSIKIDILTGNATGTAVYTETHSVTTDGYGLINLEIGKGTVTLGTFSGINWGTSTYFVKVTVDGVEMGTSQLLSVPYALYAEKAGNGFNGNYNDLINIPTLSSVARTGSYNDLINKPVLFDGTWNSLTGKPALSLVATSGSYGDLNNKPSTDGSETKVVAGSNISIAGTGTTSNPYIVNSTLSGTNIQGTNIGDMQFWNGEVWAIVPAGQPSQVLKLSSSGEPYWSGGKLATLTTSPVTSITGYSAKSGGNIITDGYSSNDMNPTISYGVCWSTSPNPTISDNTFPGDYGSFSGTGPYIVTFTGLKALTTYYLRAYATNTAGTAYGNEVSFTTASPTTPKINSYFNPDPNSQDLQISWTTFSISVEITSNGGTPITSNGVCWSIEPNPTIANSKTNDATENGYFTSEITGLSVFTTYYVRAYAINSVGITYGDEINFTTKQLELPGINTSLPNIISQTTATCGGEVLTDGGTPVTARGVCWSTLTNPTITGSKTTNSNGTGKYTSSLTGLAANTTYYARAFATNSLGTSYGNEIKFTTYSGPVTDVEGNIYNTITIGTQTWMAENLKTRKYNNGDLIGSISLDITAENEPKYQWAYNENESNTAIFGRLYTWYAITDSRKICPTGWHVPTHTEWLTLTTYLVGPSQIDAAIKLKEAGSAHWLGGTGPGYHVIQNNGTNETGFTALPGGSRSGNGTFAGIGTTGKWWTSSEFIGSSAWYRILINSFGLSNNAAAYNGNKRDGLSVRCIKD